MKQINVCPHKATKNYCRNVLELSRWKFIKLTLIAAAALFLTLVGCFPDDGAVEDVGSNLAVIDQWIEAVNSEDVTQFEQLHSENVIFSSHLQQNPYDGRENIWDSFRISIGGPIEKIYMFGQDESICLQLTASDTKRSFLYVFDFEGDLISKVYEYSGAYDLSAVPLFQGVDITPDNADLSERIDTVDSHPELVNERDYSRFIETFNDDAIMYVPSSEIPVVGADNIGNEVKTVAQSHPAIEVINYRAFGQGNLVCHQATVKGGPMRSLGFVNVFEDGKVSRVYQYSSNAELIN